MSNEQSEREKKSLADQDAKEKLYKQQIQRLQLELKSVSRAQAAQQMRNFTSSRVEQHATNTSSFKNYKTQKNDLINFHQNQSGESLGRMNANQSVSVSSAKAVDRQGTGKYKNRSGSPEDNYNISGLHSVQKVGTKASTVQQTMSQSQGATGSAYLQKNLQTSLICAPNINANLAS